MRFLKAILCLVVACVLGLWFVRFFTGPNNYSAGGSWGDPDWVIVIAFIWVALPLWLIVFLPLFFAFKKRSRIWRWYVSIPLGGLCGLIGYLVTMRGDSSSLFTGPADERVFSWLPVVIGALTFLGGAIFKSQEAEPQSS